LFGGAAALAATGLVSEKIYSMVERGGEIDEMYHTLLGTEMNPAIFNDIIEKSKTSLQEATHILQQINSTNSGVPESLEKFSSLANDFSATRVVEYAQSAEVDELKSLATYFEGGAISPDTPIFATIAIIEQLLQKLKGVAYRIQHERKLELVVDHGLNIDISDRVGFNGGIMNGGLGIHQKNALQTVIPAELVTPLNTALEQVTTIEKFIRTILDELKEEAIQKVDSY
jgi:hypothetical protein